MKMLRSLLKALKANHVVAILAVLAVAALLYHYSQRKGSPSSGMTDREAEAEKVEETQFAKNAASPATASDLDGANAASAVPASAGAAPASSCQQRPSSNPGDLLPKDNNTQFAKLNPMGSGDLEAVKLLKAGYHAGINTVGSSLRNANLQVRSEPPNPQTPVSPWLNTTIEPDLMRTPLELGCKN